jgi:hypothetical protein
MDDQNRCWKGAIVLAAHLCMVPLMAWLFDAVQVRTIGQVQPVAAH